MNQKTRSVVLERDDWECQDCGIDVGRIEDDIPTAEVHHETPRVEGGSDKPENLVTLCPNCHSEKRGKELGSTGGGSGRPLGDPSPEDVLNVLNPGEPYTVSELDDVFEDVSRWTVQRRLDALYEDGEIQKKKHDETRASWWIPITD